MRGLLAAMVAQADQFLRRGMLFLMAYILSVFFLISGVCLFLLGFYVWLVARLENPVALIIIACLLILLAVLLTFVWLFIDGKTVGGRDTRDESTEELKILETDVDRLLQDLNRLLRKDAPTFTLGAFLVGLAIGTSPKLRRGIGRWFR